MACMLALAQRDDSFEIPSYRVVRRNVNPQKGWHRVARQRRPGVSIRDKKFQAQQDPKARITKPLTFHFFRE
jgi:hypothetical protein